MHKRFSILILFVFLCISSFAQLTGKVVSITDGDSFVLLTDSLTQVKIRLHGVDCPEKNQAFGQKAKEFTSDFIFGKRVQVKVTDIDRYKRTVGIVVLQSGENLNEALLENGFAWHYKQYDKSKTYSQLEKSAQIAKKGLWVDKNPVAPWDFRKNQKNPKKTKVDTSKNTTVIICNSANAKSYHITTCKGLSQCRAETIEMSIKEAKKKGYKPCGYCY